GTNAATGHSAPNGTQHLFAAGLTGCVLPLQIGPPHWKWRWDTRLMAHHDDIAGLISYFHPLDGVQHVFAALRSGDIWESRFQLRALIATREWSPTEFPISYWYGPNDLTDPPAKYRLVAGAGFTFGMPPGDTAMNLESNREMLAAA